MTEIGVLDLAKLPEDVREKLEELDLELAEGESSCLCFFLFFCSQKEQNNCAAMPVR